MRPTLIAMIAASLLFIYVPSGFAQQAAPVQRAVGQTTSSVSAPFAKAESLLQQGSMEEARNETLEQIKLHPSSADGYKLLGIIYSQKKDYTNALNAFQHALSLDPKSAGLHNNL